MPRAKAPKTLKASKNASRELDFELTPRLEARIHEMRSAYAANLPAFCADLLKVVDKRAAGGSALVPFKLNECQLALDRLIEKIGDFNVERSRRLAEVDSAAVVSRLPIEVVVLKARKVGVSTYLEARAFWRAEFSPHTNVLVMAHERDASQNIKQIADRFDTFWNPNTDPPLRVPIARSSDDLIEWDPEHDSRFAVQTAGRIGSGSSRSFTWQFVHLSEVAHFPPESNQMASALSARADFHETYLESTANGEGNAFYDDWVNAYYLEEILALTEAGKPTPPNWNGKFKFFWPWWNQSEYRTALLPEQRDALKDTLDEEERHLQEAYGCTLEQLAWRRGKILGECTKQSAMLPVEFFRQEWPSCPEEAFVAKSQAVFDVKKLNVLAKLAEDIKPALCGYLLRDETDPTGWKILGGASPTGAQLILWEHPKPDHAYVIGADAAEGLEHGDWSVCTVFDRTNGTRMVEVARFRAKTPARELGEIIFYLGTLYHDAYAVVERNAPGNSTCEKLVELGYGGKMFHHRNIESVTDAENAEAFTAGFRTTSLTKPMLVHRGVSAIRDDEIVLRHQEAIKEWKSFVNVDGVYGAPDGRCDDTVMADLLAYFGMTEAPPMWANPDVVKEQTDEGTPEERQNAYWQKRVLALREAAHKVIQNKIASLTMRSASRNPFS